MIEVALIFTGIIVIAVDVSRPLILAFLDGVYKPVHPPVLFDVLNLHLFELESDVGLHHEFVSGQSLQPVYCFSTATCGGRILLRVHKRSSP